MTFGGRRREEGPCFSWIWTGIPFKETPVIMKNPLLNSGKKQKEKEKPLPCSVLFLSLKIRPHSRRSNHSNKSRAERTPFSIISCQMLWTRAWALENTHGKRKRGRSVHEWHSPLMTHTCAEAGACVCCERWSHTRAWVLQVKPLVPAFGFPTGLTFLCGKCNY